MKITKFEKIIGYDDINEHYTVEELAKNAEAFNSDEIASTVVGVYEDEKTALSALEGFLNTVEPAHASNNYPAFKAIYYCLDDGTFAKDDASLYFYGNDIYADVFEVLSGDEVLYRFFGDDSDKEEVGDIGAALLRELVSGEIIKPEDQPDKQYAEIYGSEDVNVMRIRVK